MYNLSETVKIIKDKLYEIIDYFCSEKCLAKGYGLVEVPDSDVIAIKNQRGPCESCGGPTRGRGWVHNKGCPEIPEVKTKRTCEECNGGAIGRGYRHLDRCSKKTPQLQKTIRLCPNCQGPARGKGFIHVKGCRG